MATVNRIINASDYAARDKVGSVRERIAKIRRNIAKSKGITLNIQFDKISSRPVYARIELGQWCANCECGGTEFVYHEEPIFFCFSCGNATDAGQLRPVIFPDVQDRIEIERLVLERPVEERRGLDDLERAHMAVPIIFIETANGVLPLTRTWNAGEPIENLVKENEAVEKWRQASITPVDQVSTEEKEPNVPTEHEHIDSELAGE